jgi:hypothetical protein
MELQDKLHEALQAMMQGIESADADIAGLVRRIDELNKEMGADAPPMLRHYLDRRSYAKALDFLEGRDESVEAKC